MYLFFRYSQSALHRLRGVRLDLAAIREADNLQSKWSGVEWWCGVSYFACKYTTEQLGTVPADELFNRVSALGRLAPDYAKTHFLRCVLSAVCCGLSV